MQVFSTTILWFLLHRSMQQMEHRSLLHHHYYIITISSLHHHHIKLPSQSHTALITTHTSMECIYLFIRTVCMQSILWCGRLICCISLCVCVVCVHGVCGVNVCGVCSVYEICGVLCVWCVCTGPKLSINDNPPGNWWTGPVPFQGLQQPQTHDHLVPWRSYGCASLLHRAGW